MGVSVFTNRGKLRDLILINAGATWQFMLYKNDYTIVEGSEYADLTEANFNGYVRVAATWTAPALDGSNRASSLSNNANFVKVAGGTSNDIYGYALVLNVGGTNYLVAGRRFDSVPIAMVNAGDSITVTINALLDDNN